MSVIRKQITIPTDLHKQAKLFATERGIKLEDLGAIAVAAYLAKNSKPANRIRKGERV